MFIMLGTSTSNNDETGKTNYQNGNIFLDIFNLISLNWINDESNIENDITYSFISPDYTTLLKNGYNKPSWVGNSDSDKRIVFDVNLDVYGLLSYLIILTSINISDTTQWNDSTNNIPINDSNSHICNDLKTNEELLPILLTISEINNNIINDHVNLIIDYINKFKDKVRKVDNVIYMLNLSVKLINITYCYDLNFITYLLQFKVDYIISILLDSLQFIFDTLSMYIIAMNCNSTFTIFGVRNTVVFVKATMYIEDIPSCTGSKQSIDDGIIRIIQLLVSDFILFEFYKVRTSDYYKNTRTNNTIISSAELVSNMINVLFKTAITNQVNSCIIMMLIDIGLNWLISCKLPNIILLEWNYFVEINNESIVNGIKQFSDDLNSKNNDNKDVDFSQIRNINKFNYLVDSEWSYLSQTVYSNLSVLYFIQLDFIVHDKIEFVNSVCCSISNSQSGFGATKFIIHNIHENNYQVSYQNGICIVVYDLISSKYQLQYKSSVHNVTILHGISFEKSKIYKVRYHL